jgi:hypothetical protein
MYQSRIFLTVFKISAIDPLLHMVLDQCGQEILGGQSSIKLKTPFIPRSKMKMQHIQPPQQVIFATAYEYEFYTKLTSSKPESRYCSNVYICNLIIHMSYM